LCKLNKNYYTSIGIHPIFTGEAENADDLYNKLNKYVGDM
jgi:hypothetical protein